MYSSIQYISQGATAAQQLANIQSVLDWGYDWIQLRWKQEPESSVMMLAEKVKLLCDRYQATLIINDHAAIAKAVDADGLHLGLGDMPVLQARELLGTDKIIGGTANTLADVLQRITESCNYIGLGPFRFTTTKAKLSPVLGMEGYLQIMKALADAGNTIPVYAVGGIQEADIADLLDTGLHGVAVSGMLTLALNHQ